MTDDAIRRVGVDTLLKYYRETRQDDSDARMKLAGRVGMLRGFMKAALNYIELGDVATGTLLLKRAIEEDETGKDQTD